MINVIIAVILIAVIGLAVYAVYGKISENMTRTAIENGEAEPTVGYLAEQSGMSVEDYLAQYGVSGLGENATQEEMTDAMTVGNYATYAGTTVEDLQTQYGLDETPSADANWGELRKTFTVRNMMGDEESFNQFKEVYGLDDSITLDTLWTDAEPKIQESIERMQEEAANATEAPATEAPAEGEATEAPAEGEATAAPEAEEQPAE